LKQELAEKEKELAPMKEKQKEKKKEKKKEQQKVKGRVSKYAAVHAKSLEDVEHLLPAIKSFDAHTLICLDKHISKQKRKRLADDVKLESSTKLYRRWVADMIKKQKFAKY